jgi:hypothetical protein
MVPPVSRAAPGQLGYVVKNNDLKIRKFVMKEYD